MAICSVKVDCPATARQGETVQARVTVRNEDTFYHWIFLTELWADTKLIAEGDEVITPGSSKIYSGYFTMPNYNVTILGWVERVSSLEPYKVVFCAADSKVVAVEVEAELWRLAQTLTNFTVRHFEVVLWKAVGVLTALSVVGFEPVLWNVVGTLYQLGVLSAVRWVVASEISLLQVASAVRWVLVGVVSDLPVALPGVPPEVPPPPPPEEKEFPWGTALLVGGGVALLAAAATRKKPT